jgi:hypothetical protein
MRLESRDKCERGRAVIGNANVHPQPLQEHGETVCNGTIVVHYQNPMRWVRRSSLAACAICLTRNSGADRKSDDELASSVETLAANFYSAAVHLHETPYQSQAESKTSL